MTKREHIELLENKLVQLESRLRTLETRLETYRNPPALPYTPWAPGVVWTSCNPQTITSSKADCDDAYVYITKFK